MRQSSLDPELLILEFSGKTYTLKLQSFEHEVDVDEVLKIDYSNIMGELLTFPVLFNRIGILKAEIDNLTEEEKFDTKVLEAQLSEEYRKKILAEGSKATAAEVENRVIQDKRYQVKKKNLFTLQRNQSILDSLYWSAKSKDDKLNKMTDKLRPEEFSKELLEDTVNGVLIKQVSHTIKNN